MQVVGSAVGFLRLDSSQVGRAVAYARAQIQSLRAQTVDDTAAMTKAYQTNYFAARDMAAGFGLIAAASALAFGKAIKDAIAWEQAMADIERTTFDADLDMDPMLSNIEENSKALSTLEDQLMNLGARVPTPQLELGQIASEAGALGLETPKIAKFTEVVAGLGATTELTTKEAADNLARIGNIMGASAEDYENMASTILQLGRSTAATEPEIVNMARRIAGAGKTVGLSTDQVLAYAAALASVGVREEQGGSAISRTFIDIQDAVSGGGEELELFAAVSGETTAEFAKHFREDASGATNQFIAGLGHMQESGGDVLAVLNELGITEVRQRDAILRLASAGDLLAESLGIGSQAFKENAAFAEITGRYYNTTGAQIDILKNQFFQISQGIGEQFLPVLKLLIGFLQLLINGWQALGPAGQFVITMIIALTGATAALGVAVLFLIPRIKAAKAYIAEYAATSAAAATQVRLLGVATKTAGVLITLATAALAIFGATADGAGDSTETLQQTIDQLASSMASAQQQMNQGNSEPFKVFLAQTLAAEGLMDTLQELGLTAQDVFDYISSGGFSTNPSAGFTKVSDVMRETMQRVEDGTVSADNKSDQLSATLQLLSDAYWKNEKAARDVGAATKDLGIEEGVTADEAAKLNEEMDKQKEKADQINNAQMDLIDAIQSQKQAQLSIKDAIAAHAQALDDLRHKTDFLRAAEIALSKARLEEKMAAEAVRDAEEDLRTARARQQMDYRRAVLDNKQAQLDYIDAVESVREAEQALQDLQSGPTVDEIRDATLALADARQRLRDSTLAVEDAEWQLQYLREEGASDRDLLDAQYALEDAMLSVAHAEDDVIDSTKEYNDVMDGSSAEELEEAQQDLLRAQLDAAQAALDAKQAQMDLKDAQDALANDEYYKQALIDLKNAQLGVYDAQKATRDALAELQALQGGSLERAYEEALLGLEGAYIRLAQANVEVQKQQTLARGGIWNSETAARALKNELLRMGQAAVGPVAANIRDMGETIRVATLPRQARVTASITGIQNVLDGIGTMDQALVDTQNRQASNWSKFWSWMGRQFDWFKRNFSATGIKNFFGEVFTLGDYEPDNNAKGGFITRPTLSWVGEAGPELILPLNDLGRAMKLLDQSGLIDAWFAQQGIPHMDLPFMDSPRGGGSLTGGNVYEGDVFNQTFQTQADANQIASQIMWRKRIRTRR